MTSKNGEGKIKQLIGMMRIPFTRKGSGSSSVSSDELIPNQYLKKDLGWLIFEDEPKVQEKQPVWDH